MKCYLDLNFSNHPSISSECIKFLCHNSSYAVVELLQQNLKKMEEVLKDLKDKLINQSKSVNTTSQNADEFKKSVADLTKTVNKIDKK